MLSATSFEIARTLLDTYLDHLSGCPELGAIPSLMVGRDVYTVCGPWDHIDTYLRK